jgi:hypothetical protein
MITREQIDAAITDAMKNWAEDTTFIERIYAIAFEAGRVAEREDCEKLATINRADLTAEAIRARGDTK